MSDNIPKIKQLPDYLIAQIAAGEVIESPASVIKELVENSIDAKSSKIEIFVEDNGLSLIQVRDNGDGISAMDLPLALTNFATSKISKIEDLQSILSMGFRGEALGSIRSIAEVTIVSRARNSADSFGHKIEGAGNQIGKVEIAAIDTGTQIEVKNLFYTTPVRKQFLEKDTSLQKKIMELLIDIALSHFDIEFHFRSNSRTVFSLPAQKNLAGRIIDLYGADFLAGLMPFYGKANIMQGRSIEVEGYVSNFNFYKSNGSYVKVFVNNRVIDYKKIIGSLRYLYGEMLPQGRFPVAFIFLTIPQEAVDVNVHPQKKEVRFKNEANIKEFILSSIRKIIHPNTPYTVGQFVTTNKSYLKNPGESNLQGQQQKLNLMLLPQIAIEENLPADLQLKIDEIAELSSFPEAMAELPWPTTAHARLYGTFVLASSEEGVFLVDQHTAHERINYESFLQRLEKRQSVTQLLAIPVALQFSPAEKIIFSKFKEKLREFGFVTEDFGPAGIQLQEVPFFVGNGDEENSFSKALQLLEAGVEELQLFDQLAKDLSCKASIRKGDDESSSNISLMLENLRKCRVPSRCPHGRPTMIFLGKRELFDLFKRLS